VVPVEALQVDHQHDERGGVVSTARTKRRCNALVSLTRVFLLAMTNFPASDRPGRSGEVPVPLVQPHETVAAGVARFVVRTRDVAVE
jgi:hypothetical protein